ncbi:MAG: hypothetical protein IJ466_00960 [Clostridia bacterium]|nr:hypothetical protein [Clostridia bacterium]
MRNFMAGRNGSDQLGMALILGGLVLVVLASITNLVIIHYLGLALYVYALFRMFSRNVAKRRAENEKYMNFRRNYKTNISQFFARMKNSKQFKYFRCPECKARLRLPRKVGEVTVTCGKCRHQFKQKA